MCIDRLNVQEGFTNRIILLVSLLVAQLSGIMVGINDNYTKDNDATIDCLLPHSTPTYD